MMNLRTVVVTGLISVTAAAALCLNNVKNTTTTLTWDAWGSAHIEASDEASAAFGQGWAQMRSNSHTLLCLFAAARAELAQSPCPEPYGGAMASDKRTLLFAIPEKGDAWLAMQSPEIDDIVGHFVAGINAFFQMYSDSIEPEYASLLPITKADVFRRLASLTTMNFPAPIDDVTHEVQSWKNGSPSVTPLPATRGSNAAAIASSKSTTGDALLMANPHLPWFSEFRWFEHETILPDRRFNGVVLLGLPGHMIGFNDFLGWTHTVGMMMNRYYFELELSEDGYVLDGEVLPFTSDTYTITNQQNETISYVVKRSIFGPVVAEQEGKALTLWTVGRDAPFVLQQYHDMVTSSSLGEFEAALREQALPMFSTVYADKEGNIAYYFGGRSPIQGVSSNRSALFRIGTSRSNLPSGVIDFDNLPNVVNPDSGWVQNANDPPWTATIPSALDPNDYTAGLVPENFTNLRAQRLLAHLLEKKKVSLEDLSAFAGDTTVELALRVLPSLLEAAENSTDKDVLKGAAVLKAWNRKLDTNSTGAPLFIQWVLMMPSGEDVFSTPYNPQAPLEGPRGLSDPSYALSLLGKAVKRVTYLAGDPYVSWGDLYGLPNSQLPANGGPDPLGVLRATYYVPNHNHPGFTAVGGDGFTSVMEFGDQIQAKALLALGNFTEERLPGTRNQLKLYSENLLRPVLRVPLQKGDVLMTEELPPSLNVQTDIN